MIRTSVEWRRGCGYRKPGGLYLVSSGDSVACGRLPFPLGVCPTCGGGMHQTRSFRWIDPVKLFGPITETCKLADALICRSCPAGLGMPARAGLMWVGRAFYPTPAAFMVEAGLLGISKRIASVPRGFKVGEDWVFLAHPQAITVMAAADPSEVPGAPVLVMRPGIFTAWRPRAVEYIVTGKEDQAKLDRLEERGIELVQVVRAGEDGELPFSNGNGQGEGREGESALV